MALSYDPLGRLYKVQAGAAGQRFIYDGAEQIAQMSDAGIMQRRYVRGPGADEVLVEYAGPSATFLQTDERGSIVFGSDATGERTATNSYDEYGIPSTAESEGIRPKPAAPPVPSESSHGVAWIMCIQAGLSVRAG